MYKINKCKFLIFISNFLFFKTDHVILFKQNRNWIIIFLILNVVIIYSTIITEHSFFAFGQTSVDKYYSNVNTTKLDEIATNSPEFKEKTIGFDYALAGIISRSQISENNTNFTPGLFDVVYSLSINRSSSKTLIISINPELLVTNAIEYTPNVVPTGYPWTLLAGSTMPINASSVHKPIIPLSILVLPPTPLQQAKNGIDVNNIQCFQGLPKFQLITKAEDGSPACVKPDTAQILLERGWAKTIS